MQPSVIVEAAEAFGVEQQYWDIWGKPHEAPDDVLRAILCSLGLNSAGNEALSRSLFQRQTSAWTTPLPHTLVLSQSNPTFAVSLPAGAADASAQIAIAFEHQGKHTLEIALKDQLPTESIELNGHRFIRKQLTLAPDLPLGYHLLTLTIPGVAPSTAKLIIAPDRVYRPDWLDERRAAGIAVSLYGLRSHRNWGCGDTADLRALVEWVAEELGASFIALNPLHAIPNRQPYNTSPYLPNSAFYRNHIYLDLEAIDDWDTLALSAEDRLEIAELRTAPLVEYERVSDLKLRFLRTLFERFTGQRNKRRVQEFESYIEREGRLLHLFALHSALDEAMHRANPGAWNFSSWPKPYQNPDSPETKNFAEQHDREILFHKYIQWQLEIQFEQAHAHARSRGLSIGIYHDLALATDRFGADVWAHRPFYATGCRVGAPPDDFSPQGQDWGFPPPNSQQHFEDGYQLFAQSIRKASAHGGALRIDHVMRFFRLYWIPDGKDATQGTYVRDRYHDLIRVLALESVRGRFIVVGEDLGTVPEVVRETLHQFGVFSYRLFYFERDRTGRFYRPEEYPEEALVSATTHDLPTLAGFWQNADIEARRLAGVLPDRQAYQRALAERASEKQRILHLLKHLHLLPESYIDAPELTGELHNAIIGFLASTPSRLLIINQEDLFKDTAQQNLPGTTAEHPNWRRKMKYSIEEIRSDAVRDYTRMLRSWLVKTGRLNPPT